MIDHKLLTLLEGKCWHKIVDYEIVPYGRFICSNCHEPAHRCKNPDYSSPNTYMPFLQWFWKEKKEMWKVFYWWGYDEYLDAYRTLEDFESFQEDYSVWSFSLTDEGEPRVMILLSEWLALPETRERWGWEECPECKGEKIVIYDRDTDEPNGNDYEPCPKCNGTGRIKAEWAKEV